MPGGTLASNQARTSRRKRCCVSVYVTSKSMPLASGSLWDSASPLTFARANAARNEAMEHPIRYYIDMTISVLRDGVSRAGARS